MEKRDLTLPFVFLILIICSRISVSLGIMVSCGCTIFSRNAVLIRDLEVKESDTTYKLFYNHYISLPFRK